MTGARNIFFARTGVSRSEILVFSGYLLLTVLLLYFFQGAAAPFRKNMLIAYAVASQFLLYFLGYGSLRKLSVFLICLGIAALHFYGWMQWHGDPLLQTRRGHAATGLRNTFFLLVLYQVLRFISLGIQRRELVAPSKGSATDLYDGRDLTVIDYLLCVVYCAALFLLLDA